MRTVSGYVIDTSRTSTESIPPPPCVRSPSTAARVKILMGTVMRGRKKGTITSEITPSLTYLVTYQQLRKSRISESNQTISQQTHNIAYQINNQQTAQVPPVARSVQSMQQGSFRPCCNFLFQKPRLLLFLSLYLLLHPTVQGLSCVPFSRRFSQCRYCRNDGWTLSVSAYDFIVETSSSVVEEIRPPDHQSSRRRSNNLAPLSFHPLLVESKNPLLSSQQCRVLKTWIRDKLSLNGQQQLTQEMILQGEQNREEGALILVQVQKEIHSLLGERPQDPLVLPRYLNYKEQEPRLTKEKIFSKDCALGDILPDGLHVDANNSKHFRHWTVLLYLDTCETLGATTFPFAVPVGKAWDGKYDSVQSVAKRLIMEEDMYHTRCADATQVQLDLGKELDETALDLVRCQFDTGIESKENGSDLNHNYGIRVMPRQGHICIFSGLTDKGYPNPLSFHGGEALLEGESKELLTFFYEIPIDLFRNRDEFGIQVKEREERFLHLHRF